MVTRRYQEPLGWWRAEARLGAVLEAAEHQQVYILAQQKIETAARQSALLAEAQKNTTSMLNGMPRSLGFQQITVTYGTAPG